MESNTLSFHISAESSQSFSYEQVSLVAKTLGTFCTSICRLKLVQKSNIILKIESQIVYPVLKHGGAFYAHAKGKASIFFAVDAGGFQNIRVDHATSKDFEPSGVFTDITALAATD